MNLDLLAPALRTLIPTWYDTYEASGNFHDIYEVLILWYRFWHSKYGGEIRMPIESDVPSLNEWMNRSNIVLSDEMSANMIHIVRAVWDICVYHPG